MEAFQEEYSLGKTTIFNSPKKLLSQSFMFRLIGFP